MNRRMMLAATASAPMALVIPSEATENSFDLKEWLDEQSPKSRANWHMSQLTTALNEMNPGFWLAVPSDEVGDNPIAFVSIIRHFEKSKRHTGVQVNYIL